MGSCLPCPVWLPNTLISQGASKGLPNQCTVKGNEVWMSALWPNGCAVAQSCLLLQYTRDCHGSTYL